MIYQLASKFGGRPHTYLDPDIQLPTSQLSIDFAIYALGADAENQAYKAQERKLANQHKTRRSKGEL